jgi:hypothetical protein
VSPCLPGEELDDIAMALAHIEKTLDELNDAIPRTGAVAPGASLAIAFA